MVSSYEINICQGDNFSLTLKATDGSGNPIDLSDYSISSEFVEKYGKTSGFLGTFDVAIVDGPNGIVNISLTNSYTASIPVSQYVYDVEATADSSSVKFLTGYVNVYPEIASL
jgi:hypothetical protein